MLHLRFSYEEISFFQKPTEDSLRQYLEAITKCAKKHKVSQISVRKAGYEFDRFEWHKVERLIKAVCAQSNLTITIYDQNETEKPQKQDETPVSFELGQAQRQYEALSKLIQWSERG